MDAAPNDDTETLKSCPEAVCYESEIDVERLGRQRPDVFSTTFKEVVFITCVMTSLTMADFVIGGFQIVLPLLIKDLDIPEDSKTWPANVLTLVAGAFLFPLGRLTDMYGGYIMFNVGTAWFSIWTLVTAFSSSFDMLVICRAMQGLGTSAFLPAGISMLGKIYRPGPRKNLVFSIYGALAPLGFWFGVFIGGMAGTLLSWKWYFLIGSTISMVSTVAGFATIPRDTRPSREMNVKMDWLGLCTICPTLMLMVYAITAASSAGWDSPQVIVTLVVGVALLPASVYVEGWKAENPLIPADIFHVKYMKRMLACLTLTWGAFSIFLFYATFYIELVLHRTPFVTALWFTPWPVAGAILALTSGFLLHVLPGRLLLVIAGTCKVIAMLLFACMPNDAAYWPWVFPAMIAEAACADVLWTVSNVFLTTSLPKRRQGLAGALISVTLFVGGALFLAIAEVAVGIFEKRGMSLEEQYRGVFVIGTVVAGIALFLCFFIKLGKAGCALTVDEEKSEEEGDKRDRMDEARSEKEGLERDKTTGDWHCKGVADVETAGRTKEAILARVMPRHQRS